MYNKQVIDYAELLLKHKQAQQELFETLTQIDVIQDNIENNTEDTQTKVVITNIVDDMLFLWNKEKAKGYHIFYDDEEDLKFAKFKFGLEV